MRERHLVRLSIGTDGEDLMRQSESAQATSEKLDGSIACPNQPNKFRLSLLDCLEGVNE